MHARSPAAAGLLALTLLAAACGGGGDPAAEPEPSTTATAAPPPSEPATTSVSAGSAPAQAQYGCLGSPARGTPPGGWYVDDGGVHPAEPSGRLTRSSPALSRLTAAVQEALPGGSRFRLEPDGAQEIADGSCVVRRTVTLRADDGSFVTARWEQLAAPRSKASVPHVGPLTWDDEPDGEQLAEDGAELSYRAVLRVDINGRAVLLSARGARSHSTAGWPSTSSPPATRDQAPYRVDELREATEQLVRAQQ